MTLPLFLAAAAAEASIPERFGLEPKYVVMQVISFLIVLAVLYYFGIKPVTATMEQRNQKIAAGIKDAEVVRYTHSSSVLDLIGISAKAAENPAKIELDLAGGLLPKLQAGRCYLLPASYVQ